MNRASLDLESLDRVSRTSATQFVRWFSKINLRETQFENNALHCIAALL